MGTAGGSGAYVDGDVSLTAGEVLQIVVGAKGGTGSDQGGGGGGGSFVYVSGAPQPIIVAGAGGGGNNGATLGIAARLALPAMLGFARTVLAAALAGSTAAVGRAATTGVVLAPAARAPAGQATAGIALTSRMVARGTAPRLSLAAWALTGAMAATAAAVVAAMMVVAAAAAIQGGGSTLGGAGGGSYSADLSNVALTAGENTGNGEVVINVISLVPEPSTFALIGGTLGLLALARRKNAG